VPTFIGLKSTVAAAPAIRASADTAGGFYGWQALTAPPRIADIPIVHRRPRSQALLLAVGALGFTAVVLALPSLWIGESVAVHAVVNTAIALTALFTALVVVGRVRAAPELRWVGLLAGLVLLAGAGLPFSVVPAAVGDESYFGVWAPLLASLAGVALVAAAAVVGDVALRRDGRWSGVAVTAALTLLAVIAGAVDLLRPVLDGSIPPQLHVHRAAFAGPTTLVVTRCLNAVLWTTAAIGFVRRAERAHDAFAGWIAAGCVLEAVARIQNLAVPSSYPNWFLFGDLFRLAGYLLLAAGAVSELMGYWRRLADAAVLDERRRIARDIHDGLAQELAYIAAEADGELALSAQRALDESRRAIAALTRRADEPLAAALAQAAEDVGHRWGTHVRVVVEKSPEVDADVREQLVRIVREAVTNAARHAGADEVLVEVGGGSAFRVRVVDAGRGFDVGLPQRGHGLVSMRERARALGATFDVRSRLGGGTEVEVTLA
jgi:signal transduction histidine kinase